ncbi:50S ribosomal protein L11 [Candidatus Bathyarchaeota archaeon]|nr:MAG: 50S ribosomal protein L11 [Candidatus Bathyarchaeota archaeon]
MGEKKTIDVLVRGGEATAGPPIGPALGPLGVNVPAIVKAINEATKEYAGMRVPVKITVDVETKEFEIEVGIPTTAALILKELKAEKGSGKAGLEPIGDLSFEAVVRIAKIRRPKSLAKTLKGVVKEVLGTCLSMGVTVEGKNPKEVIREVDQGIYDKFIAEE